VSAARKVALLAKSGQEETNAFGGIKLKPKGSKVPIKEGIEEKPMSSIEELKLKWDIKAA
jgi:hypothetical protein